MPSRSERPPLRASTPGAAIHFLGRSLSHHQLHVDAEAAAGLLAEAGVGSGDRVLLVLQNMPQAAILCRAIWRLGAVAVPVNPMYKVRELRYIVQDCRPAAAVVLDALYRDIVGPAFAQCSAAPIFTTSPTDYADPGTAAELGLQPAVGTEDRDLLRAASRHLPTQPPTFSRNTCPPEDIAALVYTSGTTGPPKGAVIRHRNLTAQVQFWSDVYDVQPGDALMGVAPYFHITGLVADLVFSLDTGVPLVQSYRFDPAWALQWIQRYQPTSMVAAITVYTALLNQHNLCAEGVKSLRTCLSGGAPVAPGIVERWRERTGGHIRNCYGLTETTSLVTLAPPDQRTPVDPGTGALSVGKPVGPTRLLICDETGEPLPVGELGEVVIDGPQVISGYWEKHEETERAIGENGLHTGDVGFVDQDGWLYLVDRRKDLIIASGYKVWPREVEDVLLEHPAVAEPGVVGVRDDYRGETVVAFVAARAGMSTDGAELIAFCRSRLAAFKAPRQIHVVAELPKTASGKILRRELRALRLDG